MNRADETPQQLFVRAFKIEPKWGAVLVAEGFTTLEEVAYVPIDELRAIQGLEEQQVQSWRAQARNLLLPKENYGGDDEDPQTVAEGKSPKPSSDGAGASIDEDQN